MRRLGTKRDISVQIAWTLVVAVVLGLAFGQTDTVAVPAGLVAAVALLIFGLVRPALFIGVFLIARPLLDHYSDKTLGGASSNVGGVLGGLVIVVAAAYALSTKRRLVSPRGTVAFVMLLTLTAIFGALAFFNLRSAIGLRPVSEFVRILALFAMYFLAVNLFDTVQKAKRVIIVVSLSAIIPAIVGLVNWVKGSPAASGSDLSRISGTFVGPNPYGDYLAVCALLLIALPWGYVPRWVRLVGIAACTAALVGTYSRVGYIVFLLGILALGWRVKRGAALTAVVAAVIVVFAVPTVHDRVLPKQDPSASKAQTYESFSWRLENWSGLLREWEKSPLIGFGVGTVPFVNPRVLTTGDSNRFGGGFDAHNLAVKSLVEGGVVFLIGWAAFLASFIVIALRLARQKWPLQQTARILSIIWPLLAIGSVGTAEPTSESALMFGVLAVTGALEGAHRHWRRQQEQERALAEAAALVQPQPQRGPREFVYG